MEIKINRDDTLEIEGDLYKITFVGNFERMGKLEVNYRKFCLRKLNREELLKRAKEFGIKQVGEE